jgi:hypothetical protein
VDVNTLPLVPCRPLGPLLSMFGVAHIDLWVLDVEGAELEVLKTFDFRAITVDVVCIEQDGGNPAKDAAVRELMDKEGFILDAMNQVRNDWYVRRGFKGTQEASLAAGGGGGR